MNRIIFGVVLLIACQCGVAQHHEDRAHEVHANEVHVHGVARMTVVYDSGNLVLELASPAVNILGFEHAPHTAVEQEKVNTETQVLSRPDALIALPAECQLTAAEIDLPWKNSAEQHEPEERHRHRNTQKVKHQDIQLSYRWSCGELQHLELRLKMFKRYPMLKKINAQWIAFDVQQAETLSKKNPILELSP